MKAILRTTVVGLIAGHIGAFLFQNFYYEQIIEE